jgi:hypothetical protein
MASEPDLYEQMALDLEIAQQKRFRSSKNKKNFFDSPLELSIHETINTYRDQSITYPRDK